MKRKAFTVALGAGALALATLLGLGSHPAAAHSGGSLVADSGLVNNVLNNGLVVAPQIDAETDVDVLSD